VVKLQQEVVKR